MLYSPKIEVYQKNMDKDMLKRLYSSGMSMADIAKQLKFSVHKVVYWMDKYGLPRRSMSEAVYIKRNPDGDPFKIAPLDSSKNLELFSLGVGLFLGEGSKRQRFGVRLANSDPKIIELFLKFLKQICGVSMSKIHAWINIFNDRKYGETLEFWSHQTGIPKANFYSPTLRARRGGTYKNRSKYGTITVIINNKKLRDQILKWCDSYLKKYAGVA